MQLQKLRKRELFSWENSGKRHFHTGTTTRFRIAFTWWFRCQSVTTTEARFLSSRFRTYTKTHAFIWNCWWLQSGFSRCDIVLSWCLSNSENEDLILDFRNLHMQVSVHREAHSLPKRLALRLHDTVARFRTGKKFSLRCRNRVELTPVWCGSVWHFLVISCERIQSYKKPDESHPAFMCTPLNWIILRDAKNWHGE